MSPEKKNRLEELEKEFQSLDSNKQLEAGREIEAILGQVLKGFALSHGARNLIEVYSLVLDKFEYEECGK